MKNHQEQDQETMKNPNLNHHHSSTTLAAGEGYATPPQPPPPPQNFKKIHQKHDIHVLKKINENEAFTIKNTNPEVIKKLNSLSCSSPATREGDMVEESGRDRLKRHRAEMASRVRIPDIWGHEDLLKDWIDCTVFDSSLGNKTIMSARAALVQERRSNLRIENQC